MSTHSLAVYVSLKGEAADPVEQLRAALLQERATAAPVADPVKLRGIARELIRSGDKEKVRYAETIYEAIMYRRMHKIVKLALGGSNDGEVNYAVHEYRLWRVINDARSEVMTAIKSHLDLRALMPEEEAAEK